MVVTQHNFKSGKSPGTDSLPPEFFKQHVNFIIPYLELLFNAVLDTGVFPDTWNVGMIVPLYKKGDKHDPNNYRGISLLNIMGKIYFCH